MKWKFKQLKKKLLYLILYRAYWKKLWVSESDHSNWEIVNDSNWEIVNDSKKVTLLYIPEDDYSKNDIHITVPYHHFEDLIKFMIRIR